MYKIRNLLLTVMLCVFPSTAMADIIIDNNDQGFQTTGSGWDSRTNPPWTSSYGDGFLFNTTGDGSSQAIYTFTITEADYYEIYGWWMSHSYVSQDTPYTIYFSDGTVTVAVNQQQDEGQWNLLASGYFEPGEHKVIISNDASGNAVIADAVKVAPVPPVNNPPVLDSIGNKSVQEGELLEFSISATDQDGDQLTFSTGTLPAGADFNPVTQLFSWIPDFGSSGNYTVTFTVTDDGEPNLSDSEEITITVGNVNRPPELVPVENKIVNEGDLLEFTISASDPDGDALIFTFGNMPQGAYFDNETGLFTWIPGFEQSGHNLLTVTVSDGIDTDQMSIVIDVTDSYPLGIPTGVTVTNTGDSIILNWNPLTEEELAGFNVYRSTADPGKYEKINNNLIAGTEFTDNNFYPETGYFYFITAVDIFNHSEVFAAGIDTPVGLTLDNEGRLFVGGWTSGLIWDVDLFGNASIYASGLGRVNQLVKKDENLYITDYDGGPVQKITPDGSVYLYADTLVLEYPTGLVFNSLDELFVAEDYTGNIYKILSDEVNWELYFSGLQGPGALIFDESENMYVSEDLWVDNVWVGAIDIIDQAGNLSVLANLTDPDGICFDDSGNLYVAQSHLDQISKVMPDGSSMPIIQDIATWGCVVNKYNELLVTMPWDNQVMKIHFTHESEISEKVFIISPYYNIPPALDPVGNKEANTSEQLQFMVTASDVNDENLTFSADNLPGGASIDPATGIFSWTPTKDQAGTHSGIVIRVTDDGTPQASDSETISITVNSVNHAPVMGLIGDKSIIAEDTLTFMVTATDIDGDNLTYTAENLPPGASIDPVTGTFTWTPTTGQVGTHAGIVFTVTDDGVTPESDSETITITVNKINEPPVLNFIGNQVVYAEDILTFTVSATDPDGNNLTLSSENIPAGSSFDPVTGIFSWTPTTDQVGTYTGIIFTVTDDGVPPKSDSETITITVESNVIEIITDDSDQAFEITGSGWDSRSNPPWTDAYGDGFMFNTTGDGSEQAIYTISIPKADYYEIYGWWMTHQYCSQDTPYSINFSDGTVLVNVNQQQNGGQWNFIAKGYFEPGDYQIIISNDASGSAVIADAVKVVTAP